MSLDPTYFEFEYSPPHSPPVQSTQHVVDEGPDTPKRKREGDIDTSDGRDLPNKRTSPLQQVATPDTLDLTSKETHPGGTFGRQTQNLTPMKRTVSSSQQTTPVTLVKGVNRFQIDSQSFPGGVGLVDPFDLTTSTASPPLVKPRLIDFTATSKSQVDSNVGTSTKIPDQDLEIVGDSTNDKNNHTSAINTGTTEGRVTTATIPSTLETSSTNPISTSSGSTTPASASFTAIATPQKSLSTLQKIPAIADAYVPVYVSLESPVKLRDSKQFCINPPFWKRWPKDQYLALARYLQENIDLVPFAEQESLTIEEVQHVYQAVVVEPLLRETDRVSIEGQKRIETMFKTYTRAVGLSWRKWGDENSSVEAQLGGVRPGIVQLTGKNADLIEVPYIKLTKADKEHVLSLVRDDERAILMREVVWKTTDHKSCR